MFDAIFNMMRFPKRVEVDGKQLIVVADFRLENATLLLAADWSTMPDQVPFGSRMVLDCKMILEVDTKEMINRKIWDEK